MSTNKIKKFRLLSLLLTLSFTLPILSNTYAAEARAEVQEKAIEKAEKEPSTTALSYRQALKETISIEEEFYHNELNSYVRYMPTRGANSQSGKVGIIESDAEYSYVIKAFDKLPIQLALGAGYLGIDNTTAVKLPSRLTTISFGAETTVPFFNFRGTYFTIGLAPTFQTDNWNVRASTFRLSQRYFFIYQANNKLTLVAGVGVNPGEHNAAMPILGFIYQPNDRLIFNIVPTRPEISYALTKKLTVFGEFEIVSNQYKVTKDDVKNAALEYNALHSGVGLRYEANKHIQGSFSLGGVFDRSLKYRSENYGKVSVKNGMYTELRVDIMI